MTTTYPMPQNGQRQSSVLAGVTYLIAGVVYATDVADDIERVPVAGATVQIKDHAHTTKTDQLGRYRFANLRPGEYTFVVTTEEGRSSERMIQVPPSYNITLTAAPTAEAVTPKTTTKTTAASSRRKRTTSTKPKASRRAKKTETDS